MARRSERGSALLLTIIFTVVLLFLGGSLGILAMVESRLAQREEASVRAYYLARSGADAMAQAIIDNPTILSDLGVESGPAESEPYSLGESGSFRIRVIQDGADLRIVSTGSSQGQQVTVSLGLDAAFPAFDHAIVGLNKGTKGSPTIKISGNPDIRGDVVTNANQPGSVNISGNVKLSGTFYVGFDVEDPKTVFSKDVGFGIAKLSKAMTYPFLRFPELPELPDRGAKQDDFTITADGYYSSIKTSKALRVDVGKATRTIRVGTLDLSNGLDIVNIGDSGCLNLFVEEKTIGLSGNSKINWTGGQESDPTSLTLYYYGSEALNLRGNTKINGNLVVKEADVGISGNTDFGGHLFSGGSHVIISGNIEQSLIYVRDGRVELSGNSKVGAVIANELVISGNSDIILPTRERLVKTIPKGIFAFDEDGSNSAYRRAAWSNRR